MYFQEKPGTPYCTHRKSNSIAICWQFRRRHNQTNCFQIRIKESSKKEWTILPALYEKNTALLEGLKEVTGYFVQVRAITSDGESDFSQISCKIETKQSLKSKLVEQTVLKNKGNPTPSVYAIPVKQLEDARNVVFKRRKLKLGTIF